MSEVDGTSSGLDAAVADAVSRWLDVADGLVADIVAVFDRCLAAAEGAVVEHRGRVGAGVVEAYREEISALRLDAGDRLSSQRARLATFNLVLFGRTGAGKSSLIEALSGGDGEPISEGESDWTTDVRDVHWRGTRLVDTPGVGGWGRTESRADLEARAEAAVADADVVLLCFDTQSQQEGEFAKVADWVGRYGKPVVAVLNSRNARWRNPAKVERVSTRRGLSRTVHEHAGNIVDELGRIGLPDVPVVAVHAKRAAFARTRDPYVGPDADSRSAQRERYGPDQLLRWSNLPALEQLLAAALEDHAAPLRLGMLHEQARGILGATKDAVEARHRRAVGIASRLERGVAEVLGIVGRPADDDLAAHIARLEELRGGFGTPGRGELGVYARHRIAAALEEPKAKAFHDAERLVDDAFGAGRELTADEFDRAVLAPARAAAETAARSVGVELQRYLEQRLELVASDVRADLRADIAAFEGANAGAGRVSRTIGIVLETGSGFLSVGSGGALLAAGLTAWNPAGWVLATIAGASAVGGLASSYFGGRLRRRGARQRVRAMSDARAKGRRAVLATFDNLERLVSDDFGRILSDAAHARLADDVAQATALRLVAGVAEDAIDDLQHAAGRVPAATDARHLLSDVARDLQRRRFPGDAAAERRLWLGEDWCDDPEGLSDAAIDATAAAPRPDPVVDDQLRARVRSVVDRAAALPEAGSGAAWLTTTHEQLAGDEEALAALDPACWLLDGAPPRLVLAGDYSTGKSSFIKRLLVDAGQAVPEELHVAARPTTSSMRVLDWEGWELVDTPGFQSSDADHAAAAHVAVLGGSVLVVMFNPNLVVGGARDLLAILDGDPPGGRVGKLPRTLLVINRSDELGPDPREDPAAHRNLCRRKERELVQALEAVRDRTPDRRDAVDAQQVLCVASDPFGAVGDRTNVAPADYDEHRDWDGMDALHGALVDARHALGAGAGDLRVLENGAAALADLAAARCRRQEHLDAEVAQRRLLVLDLDACLGAGHALRDLARDRLASACASYVAELFDEVAAATHDDELRRARVEQLRTWADDPEMQQRFDEWAGWLAREQEEWQETTSEHVEARLTSAGFTAAFGADDAELDVDRLGPAADGTAREAAFTGARGLAQGAMNTTRDGVTKAVHALGGKFRPWGATKLTSKVNKAGGALSIALGAVELYGVYRSVRSEADDERSAGDVRSASLRQVRQAALDFFDGDDPDAPGRSMADALDLVQRTRDHEAARLEATETEMATLAGWIRVCEERTRAALERLGDDEP